MVWFMNWFEFLCNENPAQNENWRKTNAMQSQNIQHNRRKCTKNMIHYNVITSATFTVATSSVQLRNRYSLFIDLLAKWLIFRGKNLLSTKSLFSIVKCCVHDSIQMINKSTSLELILTVLCKLMKKYRNLFDVFSLKFI